MRQTVGQFFFDFVLRVFMSRYTYTYKDVCMYVCIYIYVFLCIFIYCGRLRGSKQNQVRKVGNPPFNDSSTGFLRLSRLPRLRPARIIEWPNSNIMIQMSDSGFKPLLKLARLTCINTALIVA